MRTYRSWVAIIVAIVAGLTPILALAGPAGHRPAVTVSAGESGCHSAVGVGSRLAAAVLDDTMPAAEHDADGSCVACHFAMLAPATAAAYEPGPSMQAIAAWRADVRPDVVPDTPQKPPRPIV